MCGHLDFLWPFASQKKQINISNLNVIALNAAGLADILEDLIDLSVTILTNILIAAI